MEGEKGKGGGSTEMGCVGDMAKTTSTLGEGRGGLRAARRQPTSMDRWRHSMGGRCKVGRRRRVEEVQRRKGWVCFISLAL